MANNPYVNKVQLADGTSLIDISNTTATAETILAGYGAFGADGAWVDGEATAGAGGVVYITDEIDENGGTVRNIVTDDATITDTLDANGGTVRSITGAEVYLQSRTVQPTETAQRVTPTGDYNGLGAVNVGAIPSDYVGSAIEQRDSTDLTVSGATVTAPAGVYASSASKTVASGTATTPTTSISVTPSISVNSSGLITASASGSESITPAVSAGFVSSGTAGTVSVSGSNTSQLSTQAGTTITPTTSEQTAVASGKYTTGAVKVAAMPSGTAGTPTATKGTVSNHSVSVTPSVTNTTGYITGSTKAGTAVTVSASELVSGTKSIIENGTGIDVTNYASVDVAVPSSGSGADIPVFTIQFDENYNVTSATCSETFAQCSERYGNNNSSAYGQMIYDNWDGGNSLSIAQSSSSQITYVGFYGVRPGFDIIYHSNGTIDWVSPSAYGIELEATSNGYYYPSNGGVYIGVTVDV